MKDSTWQRNLPLAVTIETSVKRGLAFLGGIPILISVTLITVFLWESLLFFQDVSLVRFFTDTQWTPMFSSNPQYGILVLASATFLVTTIAAITAIPLGVMGGVYLSEYASNKVRRFLKPTLEALSGIPTVVLGYFALVFFTPLLQNFIPELSTFNSLSAGIIVGILITPTISSIGEDAMKSVPLSLRDGAYALGFTKSEMIIKVLLPTAFPGLIAGISLAVSRALGETMIVSIAAGQNPNLTLNPLVAVKTITAFIIQISLGTVNFGSVAFKTIFTVGTVLFLITLVLNTFGNWLSYRTTEQLSAIFTPKSELLDAEEISRTEEEEKEFTQALAKQVQNAKQNVSPQPTRLLREKLFQVLSFLAALMGVIFLCVLFYDLIPSGLPRLNWDFLTNFASRRPEEAGILAPLVGTLWLFFLTAVMIIPIGVGAAIYLEEYSPNNWIARVIEINIANLAAVPSIIYGLLGLEIFVRFLFPITGGYSILAAALTLGVIVLPTLIITSRTALRDIPDSIRQGGYAMGMTKGQVLQRIVVPSALPGLITGVLLALSRAIGETAPLIAVGASASIRFLPEGLQSKYTALPMQIFLWLQDANPGVQQNAAAATIVLIILVLFLNILAVFFRDFYRRQLT
ncbi:MAG: phosphate ABC transporter permease PstA [Halothece sp.]